MACLTENTIVEYLEGLLDEAGADAAEQHLDDCFVCRRLIVEVAATLLDSARTTTPAPSEEVVTRVTKILAKRRATAPAEDDGDAESEGRFTVPDILPEIAGRYQDRRVQGRGGQARVLVAWDEYMGREVALKQLRPVDKPLVDASVRDQLRQTAENATRFLREVRITGQLSHPSIIPVHEVGRRDDGTLYYTMPLIHGRTLQDALAQCEGLADRLALLGHFVDLCHCVAYAHSRGVIHRDLKPANVMVGEYGETILLDWGLATFVRQQGDASSEPPPLEDPLAMESGPPTPSGVSLGTPSYMSPEQAAGHIQQVDHRSDIWGLGAILYEILTGTPPYTGPSALQIIISVATKPVLPVAEQCPDAPPALGAAAQRALQRQRDSRHASAGDLAAEVTAFLTAKRRTPETPTRAVAAETARSSRLPLVLGGLGLLVVGLVAGLLLRGGPAPTHPLAPVGPGATEPTRPSAGRTLATGHAHRALRLAGQKRWLEARIHAAAALQWRGPTTSSSGVSAASALPLKKLRKLLTDRGPGLRLRWRWRAQGCPPGAHATLVLLADGRHCATGCRDGRLQVWRLSDGAAVRHTASHGISIHRLVRGPRGRLGAGTVDGIVALYTADGRLHRTLHGHRGRVRGVTFSPNGKLLVTAAEDGTLRLWSLVTNQLLHSVAVSHVLHRVTFEPDGKHVRGVTATGRIHRWQLGPRARTLKTGRVVSPKDGLELRPEDPRIHRSPKAGWTIVGQNTGLLTWFGTAPDQPPLTAVKSHMAPLAGVLVARATNTVYSVDAQGVRQSWVVSKRSSSPSTAAPPAQTLRDAQRAAGLTLKGFLLRPTPPPGPRGSTP